MLAVKVVTAVMSHDWPYTSLALDVKVVEEPAVRVEDAGEIVIELIGP